MKDLYLKLIQIIPNTKLIINNKYVFKPKDRYCFNFYHHYMTHDIPDFSDDITNINISFDKYASLDKRQQVIEILKNYPKITYNFDFNFYTIYSQLDFPYLPTQRPIGICSYRFMSQLQFNNFLKYFLD
jgi:hypothetical protein